jgi:hypothetical protein
MHTIMGVFHGVWLRNINAWQAGIDKVQSLKLNFLDEFSLYQQGELHALRESLLTVENMDNVATIELSY